MSTEVRPIVARSLLALPAALLVLIAVHTRAAGALPDAGELLYLGCLAAVLGGAVGALSALVASLERAFSPRPIAMAAAVVLASAPFTFQLGQYLELAEGLRARGTPAALLLAAGMGAASALILLVWAQQRFVRGARAALLTLLPLLAVLGYVEAHFGFSSRGLAALLAGSAVFASAATLARLLEGRALLPVALGGTALVVGLALASLGAEQAFTAGRRRVLVETSSLAHLDGHARLFGARFVGHRVPAELPRDCTPAPWPSAPLALTPAQRRNVLLVSIDTLRVDDAQRQVRGRPLMPQLARFSRGAWRAPAAYTGYPATMMALGSAFSGLMPSRVALSAGAPPSLFGATRDHFDDVSVVLPDSRYFRRAALERYIVQGAHRVTKRGTESQTTRALERLRALRKKQQSHLMWVHYYEPHEPYVKHAGLDFGASTRARYHSELAAVDRELGKLLGALEADGGLEDTLIVVFSDHGESFGEHGHAYHHYHLYPWLIRVPFVLRVPGQAPRTLGGPVHLTDIAATVLDFVGVAASQPLDGMSLLRADPAPDRVLLSEEFPMQSTLLEQFGSEPATSAAGLRARIERIERSPGYPSKLSAVQGHTQLVVHRTTNTSELYRLDQDPGVERDLADLEPAAERAMRAAITRYHERVAPQLGCVATDTRLAAAAQGTQAP